MIAVPPTVAPIVTPTSALPDCWLYAARLHRQLRAEIPDEADRAALLRALLAMEAPAPISACLMISRVHVHEAAVPEGLCHAG